MKTTYFINLDDRSKDLETANILYHSIDGNCSIKNYDSVPMMKSIMNTLKIKYEAKYRAVMNRTIASYLGNLVNKSKLDYHFDFNSSILTINTEDRNIINKLEGLGFKIYKPQETKSATRKILFCRELDVNNFKTLYDSLYEYIMNFTIIKRINDSSIIINDYDKLYNICDRYLQSIAKNRLSKVTLIRETQFKYPTVKINDIKMDIYNTKLILDIDIYDDNTLDNLLNDGWEIDCRNRAYRSKYIKFEDMLDLIYREKFNLESLQSMVALPMTFQVTEDCNLCCTYCFQTNKSHKRMSFETAKKVIDYLLTRTDENSTYFKPSNKPFILFEFVGGDGLLEIDLIDKILTYFLQKAVEMDHIWATHWSAYISTNGVLYRNDRVQEVLDKWNEVLSTTITVDGSKELHDMCRVFPDGSGSYDLAMDALLDQFNRNIGPSTKITLSPDNIKYFKDSIIDIIKHGLKHIWFNGIYEHTWTPEEARSVYLDLVDITEWLIENNLHNDINIIPFSELSYRPMPITENKNYCGGDGNMLSVNPDGEFFNCYRYMATSLNGDRDPLRIGDVDNGIANTDLDNKNISEMKNITRRSQSTDECFYCPIAYGCGWCSAYNYQLYGTCNKRTTSTCNLHKGLALANLYYWNRIYRHDNLDKKLECTFSYDFVKDIISEDEFKKLIE